MLSTCALRALLAIVAALVPIMADAATLVVVPSPGTPVQDAIDAAAPGDKILLNGVYDEAIVIDKRLTLVGARPFGGTVIDAGCNASTAVTIAADGVRLERLVVRRGTVTDVAIAQRERVALKEVWTHGPGFPGGCTGTAHGLLVDGGTRTTITRCAFIGSPDTAATGYAEAAIRIAGVANDARMKLIKTSALASARGLHLANVAGTPKGVTILASGNAMARNDTGIALEDADGIRIIRNAVTDSLTAGIVLDGASDDNRLIANRIAASGGVDVTDGGSSNCWIKNSFATGTVPMDGCP